MIQFHDISKEFSDRLLFSNVNFTLNQGERIGLIGRNGTGKSTLLKIITGELSPDMGTMTIPKNYKVSYLSQFLEFTKSTVLEECCLALNEEEQYDFYKVEKILSGLGFSEEDFHKSPLSFSGGYQIRMNLTKCLVQRPNLLLLDEPTNYLDIVSMRWLQKFLANFKGELILITHDRDFMNAVCTHTMGIQFQRLKKIKGGTNQFKEQVEEEKKVLENQRANQEKKKKQIEEFIAKFQAKARQASMANSRKKMLAKMEEFEILEDTKNMSFQFTYEDIPSKNLLQIDHLSFGYTDDHLLIEDLSFEVKKGDRIAIIGKNGIGKSTLLNLIGGFLTPLEGEISYHNSCIRGHFGQTNINRLHLSNSIEQEIGSANPKLSYTAVRSICGTMMFSGDDAKKTIQILSGGEKSRVLLGKILATPCNLLLLDEPTNHLDQESVESLSQEIDKFPGATLMVTHSEGLLRALATKLIIFHQGGVEVFDGNYDEFLEKIGWEEEGNQKKKENRPKKPSTRNQSESDSKSKKIIQQLEENILDKEKGLELLEKELIQAAQEADHEKSQKIDLEMKQLQLDIDNLYLELEEKISI
ncbi:MAG: ABC-F family ATP-binding cassette domain-containing protein [Halobacteriovoraceae bacterium]|nr:ABC-F family ATP-binding cassette domain-containing protein [Halobacteriovoraceae bacterium]